MNCTKCAYVILSLTIILYNIWDFYAWIPPLCAFHQPPDLVLERPQHDLSGGLAHFGVPAVEGLEDLGEIGDEVALPDGVDFEGDVSSLVFGFVRGGAELEFALEKRMLEEKHAQYQLQFNFTTSEMSFQSSYFCFWKLRGIMSNFLVSKSSSEVERAVQNRSRNPK